MQVQAKMPNTGPCTLDGPHALSIRDDASKIVSGVVKMMRPGVTLSPITSVGGSRTTPTGTGFSVNSDVPIVFAGVTIVTGKTDNLGGFSSSFVVPMTATPGGRTVVARSAPADSVAATVNHIVPRPSLTLTTTQSSAKGTVEMSGTSFPINALVVITAGGEVVTPKRRRAFTDTLGAVNASIIVPALPSGETTVAAAVGPVTGSDSIVLSPKIPAGFALSALLSSDALQFVSV